MKNVFEVTRLGAQGAVGRAAVTREGLRTEIAFVGAAADGEIYRLAAMCGGRCVPLGVAVPTTSTGDTAADGQLQFRRTYTPNALRELGFSEPTAFVLVTAKELTAGMVVTEDAIDNDAPNTNETVVAGVTDTATATAEDIAAPVSAHVPVEDDDQRIGAADTHVPHEIAVAETAPASQEITATTATRDREPVPYVARTLAPEPAPPADHGFTPCSDAGALFAQPELYRDITAAADAQNAPLHGALTRTDGEVTLLAVPLRADEPFALLPIFCFGEPTRLDERDYLIFKLKNGVLFA